jgi:hypothetical protein
MGTTSIGGAAQKNARYVSSANYQMGEAWASTDMESKFTKRSQFLMIVQRKTETTSGDFST